MGRYRFRNAAEAHAEAARMGELRDDEVRSLREQGREGEADLRADRWNEQIRHVEAAALELEQRQRKTNPKPRKRRASTRRTRTRVPVLEAGRVSPGPTRRGDPGPTARGLVPPPPLSGPSPGELAGTVVTRSGVKAAASSWGELAWQLAGMVIGIALLTLLVSKRGADKAAGLFGALAGAVRLVVAPIDPLAPGAGKQSLQLGSAAATAQLKTMTPVVRQAPRQALLAGMLT